MPTDTGAETTLVVISRVKEYVSEKNMRMSGMVADALTNRVVALLNDAIWRAKENGRQTIQHQDI